MEDIKSIVRRYSKVKGLQPNNIDNRSWLLDILFCVNSICGIDFTPLNMFKFIADLQRKHSCNNNIEAKIRQQLQILRDKGFIEFLDRDNYRKVLSS